MRCVLCRLFTAIKNRLAPLHPCWHPPIFVGFERTVDPDGKVVVRRVTRLAEEQDDPINWR